MPVACQNKTKLHCREDELTNRRISSGGNWIEKEALFCQGFDGGEQCKTAVDKKQMNPGGQHLFIITLSQR